MKQTAQMDPPPMPEHTVEGAPPPEPERATTGRPRPDGVLVIDKPRGPTSHDVVARLRRVLGVKRIGHAGTLDPMASGVLVVLVGEATKLAPYLTAQDKRYTARVVLGVGTDTLDADGEITAAQPLPAWLDDELGALAGAGGAPGAGAVACAAPRIAAALDAERARREQTPPAYSAIKVAGQRSYALARAGQAVDLAARAVEVRSLAVAGASRGGPATPSADAAPVTPAADAAPATPAADALPATLELELEVSKGYYVRSLAGDLGAHLGVPAHLSALRRTASGAFTVAQAVALDAGAGALRAALRPLAEAAASSLPVARLTEDGTRRARLGQSLTESDFSMAPARPGAAVWLDPDGHVVALGAPDLAQDAPEGIDAGASESSPALLTTRFSVLRGFTGGADTRENPAR
ncbi:tRNA pseudouridine(55) synthase TruB [Sorangium sp. So ce1014]|uniref:tRNA pseudouridine synthase B n=1 Tax=Sorangium sp. So ce1014 TaxID=3133326 RepID=UPI003F63D749